MPYDAEISALQAYLNSTSVTYLDEGSYGITFRVSDGNRDTALKLFKPHFGADRSEREISSIQQISSPYVVSYIDRGEVEIDGQTRRYFRTQFIVGKTLDEEMKAGTIPEAELIDLIMGIARGLDALQLRDISHRDLKPDNIMIRPDGQPVIIDLGLARQLAAPRLTASGQLLGNEYYAAPEQLRTSRVDIRADLYALGVIAYEAAAGYGNHPSSTALNLPTEDRYNALMRTTPHLHPYPKLQTIVAKLLEPKAYNRLNSPRQLIERLERL